jgi:hypothetical protein
MLKTKNSFFALSCLSRLASRSVRLGFGKPHVSTLLFLSFGGCDVVWNGFVNEIGG